MHDQMVKPLTMRMVTWCCQFIFVIVIFFTFLYFSAWLIDYFSYKGVMHLVFDRLDCNLHHILLKNSNKGLPLYIVKECARHILEALRFLAANMVVHGDVKMSNIMWNANRGLFQLVDFALSFVKENQVR